MTMLTRGTMVMVTASTQHPVSHWSQGGSQVPTMTTGEEGWRWHHHNTREMTTLEAVTAGQRATTNSQSDDRARTGQAKTTATHTPIHARGI
jgi:hypothetical protein